MYHIRTSGNGTPAEWLRKAAGRADMTHFKDYKVIGSNRVLCPVGQGVLEWADIFRACSETGVKYCFAEQEDWEKDAFECLAEAYQYIKANLNL
jgi:sugar phosphate isomerase/epimerase